MGNFEDISIQGWAIVQAEWDEPSGGDYVVRLSLSARPPEKWRELFQRQASVTKWGESGVEVACSRDASGEEDFERYELALFEAAVTVANSEYRHHLTSEAQA